ncbi:hypothetical protein LUZ60_007905 [Juncus effusus]|nr:hypothetical protein LUZ60_007905 [Juncus effusus]
MDRLLLLTNPPMATTSQNTNAGPKYEDSPQTEREEDLRDWAGLNEDLLSEIFRRMGTIAGACRSGSVCQAWRKTAKNDDQLWRRIDMTHNDYSHDPVVGFMTKPETLSDRARRAIDTSGCRLKEFWVEYFCDDKLLQYLYDSMTNEGLKAILEGCPLLETLDIRGSQNVKMDSAMWARCVRLTTFRPPEDSLDDYECKDDCCEFMNLCLFNESVGVWKLWCHAHGHVSLHLVLRKERDLHAILAMQYALPTCLNYYLHSQ